VNNQMLHNFLGTHPRQHTADASDRYYYCSYAVMPFGLAGPSTYLVVQENRIRC